MLEPGEPGWIARLAAQELARLRLARSAPGSAEELLRSAIARWPADPSPKLLLAWLLDSRGHRAEATALLDEVDRQPDAALPSPRYRYNAWPHEATARLAAPGAAGAPAAAPEPGR